MRPARENKTKSPALDLARQKSASAPAERLAYSVAEAAVVTGLSRSKLYELIQSRELASLKICGRRLLRREALIALLDGGAN